MRQFAIFTGWHGDPIAVRADAVLEVHLDYDQDDDGNYADEPNGNICLVMSPGGDENEIIVKGTFAGVLQELEACLGNIEDWQRS